MKLIVELTPEQAAGLRRFCSKISYEKASSVLYGHVDAEVRGAQTSTILSAVAAIESALVDADVSSWPWVETGRAGA